MSEPKTASIVIVFDVETTPGEPHDKTADMTWVEPTYEDIKELFTHVANTSLHNSKAPDTARITIGVGSLEEAPGVEIAENN